MVLRTILFILLMTKTLQIQGSGFDAYSSCYRTSRKRQDLPCDFGSQTWCTIPGNSYPWHAVRRFVHENQGLMRRMYGDERHISVLRAELENNDVDYFSSPSVKEEFRRRYSKDMDGAKDFVKMFINSEGRKLLNDPKIEKTTKVEKIQKSIEENSNNVLYQNHFKNPKEEEFKTPPINELNKTLPKTTTIPPSTIRTSTLETTMGASTNINDLSFVNYTTTEVENTTSSSPFFGNGDITTQPITRVDGFQNNQTKPLSNETHYEEDFDYGSETEEPPTTTNTDGLTTEADFLEEIQKDNKEENYEEAVEEGENDEQDTAKEPVPPKPSTTIRLKGINACPVKEEVVAPFWANNTRGEVLALLNLYPFEQYVHWEKCTYEHKQMFCREGCRCEQQYRLHRLLAYDPNNECRGIFSDWFRFPSCCVCKCYDLPMEFRLTSRSPRFQNFDIYRKESDRFNQQQPQHQQQYP